VTTLTDAREKARAWLFDQALPLWGDRGVDADGRFHEALQFDGSPIKGVARRTRVQARQVYVFCEAASLGWRSAEAVARRGLDGLIATCRRDDGLWRLTTDDAGQPLNERADLYDQAFVLFALAAAHRVLQDGRTLELTRQTLAAIDAQMREPSGGWSEGLPPILPRRQNPHMHLLEAILAWMEAAPEAGFRDCAATVLDLFHDRFFDAATGTLGEYFDASLSPAQGLPGRVVEPGHHFEWIWLLDRARRAGLAVHEADQPLLETALSRGLDEQGFVVREIDRRAGVIDGGRRLWAQTEGLRALALVGAEARFGQLFDGVFATHLATEVPGLWTDSYDAAGQSPDRSVPASTLYHLMTAFSALIREPARP
jgi:mannose-6-phosphate isomerase